MKRLFVGIAALVMVLSMAGKASAAIIFDQTKLVTDKGTVELIVNQVDSDTYQTTLIWSPAGYTGGATDFISNVAIKITTDTSNESIIVDPNGTWALEPDTSANFGAADGCGGGDSGSLCAKTTDVTNTTNASRTWEFQFDAASLIPQSQFHVQVQFHNSDASNAGQISTLFDGGTGGNTEVPEPASLLLFGTGLATIGSRLRTKKV